MTPLAFASASAVVEVRATSRLFRDAVLSAAGVPEVLGLPAQPDVVLHEGRRHGPTHGGHAPVTRGVTRGPDGEVLFRSAGGSGFRQGWLLNDDVLRVESTWHPTAKEAVAAHSLPARFRALRGQVLLHYPAIWWASLHGMAPLHVSVLEIGGTVVALAGPGGVGKTSLVARELAEGARATCDNLAVSNGTVMYGVREPLRVPAETAVSRGPRAAHGRREQRWRRSVPALRPDLLVVVRRDGEAPAIRPVDRDVAHRALVTGTLAAGELQRYWPMAAALALATRRGPTSTPLEAVARTVVETLPCYELQLGPVAGPSLRDLICSLVGAQESEARP